VLLIPAGIALYMPFSIMVSPGEPSQAARRAGWPLGFVPGQRLYVCLVLIYKILLPAEWDAFEAVGHFDGSPADRESGFIHLSSRDQVAQTARRVFADEPALVVVAIDDTALDETLRWEVTSSHGRFPHVYGALQRAAVIATYAVAGAADIDATLPQHP
jgi:uncharacterized protein (DUF952 family)